jgi:protein-S-isoprenylcysteine O-methyltransferase Ste14
MSILATIAAVLACLYLPVPFIMTWFHVFDRAWKRMGAVSYVFHVPMYLGLVFAVWSLRGVWPAIAWPWHPALTWLGAGAIAAAFGLLFATQGRIGLSTLIAFSQVTQSRNRSLVTTGIYARIRHPRYTMLIVGSLGNFLLTGYALLLATFVVTTALTLIMSRLEEKELMKCFGDEYRRYRERVPAFLPLTAAKGDSTPPR